METFQEKRWRWGRLAFLLFTTIILVACGGRESASTPVPPTDTPPTAAATETPEEPANAAESPLAQPESPLLQPESPLTAAPAASTPVPMWPKSEEEAIELAANTTAPEPQAGMGALSGVLYSFGTDEAIYGTGFYLSVADEVDDKFVPPSVLFGPRPENGDIVGKTNMVGQVQLDAVPPGSYYMQVWTVYSWLPTFGSKDTSEPILITVEEGAPLDLGVIYANWP